MHAFKASIGERAECYGTVLRRAATRRTGSDRRTSDSKEKEKEKRKKNQPVSIYWSM